MPGDAAFGNIAFAKLDIRAQISLTEIQSGFEHIPRDDYVRDGTRFKDIARFVLSPAGAIKSGHGLLFHPTNAGSYGGRAARSYAEIPNSRIARVTDVAVAFARAANVDAGREILIQRQRVTIDDDGLSCTVREGPHRDGVTLLAMLCVSRANVTGGVSFIYWNNGAVAFAGIVEPGEMLLIDDARFWHDATPIRRLDRSRPGHRDIIIVTSPACRAPGLPEIDTGRAQFLE